MGPSLAGDATAIGNRSETYIDQNAVATASGDGTASISQDVIVANVGAAVANTGANQLGSSAGAAGRAGRGGDAHRHRARPVPHRSSRRDRTVEHGSGRRAAQPRAAAAVRRPRDRPRCQRRREQRRRSRIATSSAQARIRQVTAIISIGISRANTRVQRHVAAGGHGRRPRCGHALPRPASGGSSITTGDASATNTSLVIVCQKDDAEGYECLRPVDPVDPAGRSGGPGRSRSTSPAVADTRHRVRRPSHRPGARPTGATSASRQLPATGVDVELLLIVGAALVVVGGLLTRVRRRAEA